MKALQRVHLADASAARLQDNIVLWTEQLLRIPAFEAVLLEDVTLTAGQDNQIAHGLDRNVRFWMLARINAAAQVYEQTSALENRYLNLHTTATCKVSLLVG